MMKWFNFVCRRIKYYLKVGASWFVDDYSYKAKRFYRDFERDINLSPPVTFNEKVIYRILFDDNWIYTRLADKVFARQYVDDKLGQGYTVPLIGVYSSFSEICFSALPEEFVLKCNHDSGSTVVVCAGKKLNKSELKRKINHHLSSNFYYSARERHYKTITPKIICEEFVDVFHNNDKNIWPELLRVHCFAGKAKFIEADYTDACNNEFVNIYDRDWVLQPVTIGYPNNTRPDLVPPDQLDELIVLSEILTQPFNYCRIDWIITAERLYFSEFTFTPCAGRMRFEPSSFDVDFGKLWKI